MQKKIYKFKLAFYLCLVTFFKKKKNLLVIFKTFWFEINCYPYISSSALP